LTRKAFLDLACESSRGVTEASVQELYQKLLAVPTKFSPMAANMARQTDQSFNNVVKDGSIISGVQAAALQLLISNGQHRQACLKVIASKIGPVSEISSVG
jgi:hypothetical protein